MKAIEGFPEPNLTLSQILRVLQTICILWDEFKVGHWGIMVWIETMKTLCFLQHLSEVVHIPHTKMQKYTDIHNYLHIIERNYGIACICIWIFKKEQLILDNIFLYWPWLSKTRTNHVILFLGIFPKAVCQCPLRH